MPIFDYLCRNCDSRREDEFYLRADDAPQSLPCDCGEEMTRLVGVPVMWPLGHSGCMIPGEALFEGTPLADVDGRNPYAEPGEASYVEPKVVVDMGGS